MDADCLKAEAIEQEGGAEEVKREHAAASIVKEEAAVHATGLILLGGSSEPSPFLRKVLAHRVNTTTARIMNKTVLVSRNTVSSHPEYARNASW